MIQGLHHGAFDDRHDASPRAFRAAVKGLHHSAYRCRDSEQTRAFYEGFLGLPLVLALELAETKTGRPTRTLHTFYRLGGGAHLAFFETDDLPFDFKRQHDFDLHVALEIAPQWLEPMLAKGREHGIECRGPSNHGMIESIYLRDPNGYVVELCAKRAGHDAAMDPLRNGAHGVLQRWTAAKAQADADADVKALA